MHCTEKQAQQSLLGGAGTSAQRPTSCKHPGIHLLLLFCFVTRATFQEVLLYSPVWFLFLVLAMIFFILQNYRIDIQKFLSGWLFNIKTSTKETDNPLPKLVGLIKLLFITNSFLIPHSLQGLRENQLFHRTGPAVEFEILQLYAVVLNRWNILSFGYICYEY